MENKWEKVKRYFIVVGGAIVFLILTINVLLSDLYNKKYTYVIKYDPIKELYYEKNEDYYIISRKMKFFDFESTCAIQIDNIYFDEMNNNTTITLQIWIDKIGRKQYKIGFDNPDNEKGDFGGYAYVDSDINYLPENIYDSEKNQYISDLIKEYKVYIDKMVEVANERWGLNMKTKKDRDVGHNKKILQYKDSVYVYLA